MDETYAARRQRGIKVRPVLLEDGTVGYRATTGPEAATTWHSRHPAAPRSKHIMCPLCREAANARAHTFEGPAFNRPGRNHPMVIRPEWKPRPGPSMLGEDGI